jgi:hypothetical protein
MKAMVKQGKLGWRRIATGLAVFMVLRHTVTFGSGDVTWTFTLVNRTSHYLHAVLNNRSLAYLPPGGSMAMDVAAYGVVVADVRYSPGQGIHASRSRVIESQCRTVTSSTGTTSTDCNQSSPDCGETSSTGTTTSTTTCTPITWSVFPADLDSTSAGGHQ